MLQFGSCSPFWLCSRGRGLSTSSLPWRLLQASLGAQSRQQACSVYRDEPQPLVSCPAADWEPVRPTPTRLTVSLGKHTAGCRALEPLQQLVQALPAEPSPSSLKDHPGLLCWTQLTWNSQRSLNTTIKFFLSASTVVYYT